MAYFTNEFIRFFKELSQNNHKEWFHDNKKRYEKYVKKPFYAFVGDLVNRTGFDIPVKDSMFRINRDIRFSANKDPYKLHMSAVISPAGRKNLQIPGLYVHLEVANVMIGGGAHMPDKENLFKIRKAIADNPEQVDKILSDQTFQKYFGGLAEADKNKILPKEFKPLGVKLPLLFNKQFYYMAAYDDEKTILRNDLVDFVMEHAEAGKAWNGFIKAAIGMESEIFKF